ncbi:MAG: sulfite exporter TauE/SafE family protein [Deltaproteobacteria bacterium]|nr:sulfite exporter TauE/SafE family protein [Deltaproteobacteria bacterium]MBW2218444.1 sulfite exporter TauE/SafE family protein [Deltaproteobacteria bacterium]
MVTETVSYHLAFLAGLASFFTPCVLPLIPAYFTFITGFSLDELTTAKSSEMRIKILISTISYVCGFSFIFILLGASASFVGGLVFQYKDIIIKAGGIIIIVLGIHLTGLFRIPGLDIEKRLHIKKKPLHFLGTFFVGMAFGAGWSPCIGPLLGSILIVAGSQETIWQGVMLLSVYSLGMALPFILMSLFINFVLVFIKKATRMLKYINVAAGAILVVTGIFLLTGNLFNLYN